jgi:hypothetical protein
MPYATVLRHQVMTTQGYDIFPEGGAQSLYLLAYGLCARGRAVANAS